MVSSTDPLVLIPAFNEEASVCAVIEGVRRLGYPVCVIDDGSIDATASVARAAGATVIRLPVNVGVGGALRCGFRYAVERGFELVVQVDADGQHDPTDIPRLLERMRATDADMVVGSRFLDPAADYATEVPRRLIMRILARHASRAVRCAVTDATSGFRAIRSPLLNKFAADYPVEYLGDTFEALLAAGRSGARVVEQPIQMSPRLYGTSSAGTLASVWYVLRVMVAAQLVPERGTQNDRLVRGKGRPG